MNKYITSDGRRFDIIEEAIQHASGEITGVELTNKNITVYDTITKTGHSYFDTSSAQGSQPERRD